MRRYEYKSFHLQNVRNAGYVIDDWADSGYELDHIFSDACGCHIIIRKRVPLKINRAYMIDWSFKIGGFVLAWIAIAITLHAMHAGS